MAQKLMTETEIAAPVVAWLQDQKWNVYQEVQPHRAGPIADIVAEQQGRVWVIEVKKSMSLKLLSQAFKWVCWANWVSIAVPYRRLSDVAGRFCEGEGIGIIQVCSCAPPDVLVRAAPRLHRRLAATYLRDCLCPEMQSSVAGSQAGGHVTLFKLTCERLHEYVAGHPKATMKAAVGGIGHHYAKDSTARACLARWIRHGCVPGLVWDGHRLAIR